MVSGYMQAHLHSLTFFMFGKIVSQIQLDKLWPKLQFMIGIIPKNIWISYTNHTNSSPNCTRATPEQKSVCTLDALSLQKKTRRQIWSDFTDTLGTKTCMWHLSWVYVWSCVVGSAHVPQVWTGTINKNGIKKKKVQACKVHGGWETTATSRPLTRKHAEVDEQKEKKKKRERGENIKVPITTWSQWTGRLQKD